MMPSVDQLRRSLLHRPILVGAVILAASAALLPVAGHVLGPTASFVPAMLTVVACFDLMSTYLLISDFVDTGDVRMLSMAAAYLWSLVLMTGYALAFPGVFSKTPPFGDVPSTAPWFYVGWHVGFPVLLAAAWAPWPSRVRVLAPLDARLAQCWRVVGCTVLGAGLVVLLVVHFAADLPTLIVGSNTHLLTVITAPVAVPLVVASLLVAWWGLKNRTGPERWATAAILICCCDLTLTYLTETRYSVGWYIGRTLTMAGAGVVLFAMFGAFRQLKAQAVANAGTDALTGLPNRRTLDAKLGRELSRSRRLGSPLSILLLDLDRLKEVNDTHGHAAGDRALQAVSAAWSAQLRPNDLLCRTGGDEFAVVLPDTTEAWAGALAVRLKRSTPDATGVSIGVATWNGVVDSDELLATADRAMYQTKPRRMTA
jgi:diguanylate cyclase (GGDEF)-like protein